MKISLPNPSLVVLVGVSGSGKSTFARRHFLPTEILSSDFCRGLVADDENDQSATPAAFEVLNFIAGKRLEAHRLTVIDATSVQPEARRPLVELAQKYHVLPVAIVLDLPEGVCMARNAERPDRDFAPHVVKGQAQSLRKSIRGLAREGFRQVSILRSEEEAGQVEIVRTRLHNDLRDAHGPFDIIGDVHGCADELQELLTLLGYRRPDGSETSTLYHPEGRKAVFVGDLVDRGPDTPGVLRVVMEMVATGSALCVPGNHDIRLVRKLRGKDVPVTHGLAESLDQLAHESRDFRTRAEKFLDGLISHYILDDGRLVVAHAGLPAEMQGRASRKVRDFAVHGETTGEIDEFGLRVRANWALEYRGESAVVYGHTPVFEAEWLNGTINIDTGCVFGGKLTALRYPERELLSVAARRQYYAPLRPLEPAVRGDVETGLTAQQAHDDLLSIEDVTGKRIISTDYARTVTIRAENAAAALETMSRFAVDPKWLIYLPPTMSPTETSRRDDYLEYPEEAFRYYRKQGVETVVCEQKHMGSRAVAILCRNPESAARRFGVSADSPGIVYTRTGRPFFHDRALEKQVLDRLGSAVDRSGLWDELQSDWVCLDGEMMPWSLKAQELLREQYAATGSAGLAGLRAAIGELEAATGHLPELADLAGRYRGRLEMVDQFVKAYRGYCWPVREISGIRFAPFHLMASEGAVHVDQPHTWHMETLARLCDQDRELLLATPYRTVRLSEAEEERQATGWWESLTAEGGEGMVVKPLEFATMLPKGLVQPALKCRGREYLRIIYGPEYTAAIPRLRDRALGAKRSLAVREFALGVEALQRFVRKEPLRRVHECVFGVLALESEGVDPRL